MGNTPGEEAPRAGLGISSKSCGQEIQDPEYLEHGLEGKAQPSALPSEEGTGEQKWSPGQGPLFPKSMAGVIKAILLLAYSLSVSPVDCKSKRKGNAFHLCGPSGSKRVE